MFFDLERVQMLKRVQRLGLDCRGNAHVYRLENVTRSHVHGLVHVRERVSAERQVQRMFHGGSRD